MFVYKSKINGDFIAANPKVLTSTLDSQKNIQRYFSKKRYIHFVCQNIGISVDGKYFFLTRNPFSRIESYFKEKLRQKVLKVFDEDHPYQLKRHQEIFYPYLNIDDNTSDEEKVKKLLELNFNHFVELLKKVYKKEDHLSLQSDNYTRNLMGIKVRPKFENILHIERKRDLDFLSNHFELNLGIRKNTSNDENNEILWSDKSIQIIQNLYHNDFELLGYSKDINDRK